MREMLCNLVVRADESRPIDLNRMLENTSRDLRERLMLDDSPDLEELAEYPTILTREFMSDDLDAHAVIGYMGYPSRNPIIKRPILTFPSTLLVQTGFLSDQNGYQYHRTAWSVIKVDPFKAIARACDDETWKSIKDTTSVSAVVDMHRIAVMMPFKEEASIDPVYRCICEGAQKADYQCFRVDESLALVDITSEIHKLIGNSSVVIADLTGMNKNVIYELGFAHGCNKQVILISADKLSNLPFDFRSQRVIRYVRDGDGLHALSAKINRALESIAG